MTLIFFMCKCLQIGQISEIFFSKYGFVNISIFLKYLFLLNKCTCDVLIFRFIRRSKTSFRKKYGILRNPVNFLVRLSPNELKGKENINFHIELKISETKITIYF